jgi:hypothetical protein
MRRQLARRPESLIHGAADAHLAKLSVAVRYAFAMGRKALGAKPDAERAAKAVHDALLEVLPGTLLKIVEDGGNAGLQLVKKLRTAGGPGSGNFGHVGRPGEVGGSANSADGAFPRAGKEVDGRTVLATVPNEGSIESSLTDYEVLSGIREIQMSSMDPEYQVRPYSKSESDRLDRLQARIESSKEIAPLIIVIDKEKHPYILEGGHRFDALRRMGAKSFPALVVLDQESLKTLGGPGSGNFGHAGRPGEVGGSSAGPLAHNEWKDLSADPEYLYHATNVENAGEIAGGGLETHDPSFGTDQEEWPDGKTERRSYFIDTPAKAYSFAPENGQPVLLRVRRDSANFKRESTGDYYTKEKIAADKLSGVTSDKTWVPLALRTAKAVTITFNAKDKNAIKWAKKHAAEMATSISKTTRDAINSAIVSLLEGASFEESRDAIAAAVGDEDRAQRIAHHETMTAASEGQRQAWDQATEKGLLTGNEERTWIVTDDDKLCPICKPLDGEKAPLGGEYQDGIEGPPAHIGCRCTEGLV